MDNYSLGIDDKIVEEALYGMLLNEWDVDNSALENCRVRTFEQDGVMTLNRGLVIYLPDGSEFQVTIIQSR